ncbi:MAG TPA: hypothetical protein VFX37_10535 [Pseudolabrys sp.]|nr:hypothetical protein [Pseudolabrys sp.]
MAGEENEEVVNQDTPVAGEGETPETPQGGEGEGTGAEGEKEKGAAAEAEGTKEEAEPQPDWRDKELKRKHAQIKDKERRLEEREREIEQLRKANADLEVLAQRGGTKAEGEKPASVERPTPQTIPEERIKAEAQKLRDTERYNENLVTINSAGEKNYGKEWGKALDNLATLGTVEMDTMQAIMATDAPEKVLYELGKNPGEYQRIMELPKYRQHTEFVKLSLKEAPKPKPSAAPEPTDPVNSRVTPSAELNDKMDDEAWYKKRAEQRAARRKERMGA